MTVRRLPKPLAHVAQAWCVLCALSTMGVAQATQSAVARIDSVFSRYTPRTPGCAVLVRQNNNTLYSRNYGLASLELSTPISSHTVFNIASMSKAFTAASIVLLAQDRKLSLDDDVRKYVPELPDLGGPVTLRQLLTHTSGWRDYVQLLVWQGHQVRDHVTPLDAVNVLRRQRALNFPPGDQFRYSNTGYFLMSLVVQRITGDSLPEFARKRIFEPLGMHDTRYVPDMRTVVRDRATAYEPSPAGGWREAMSGWEMAGDGGVFTTVEDLARWDENFTSHTVGGPALTELMSTQGKLRNGVPVPYGLGLFVDQYFGQRRVWHNGIWAGYRSIIMRFPDARVSIIALCNAADAGSEQLADAVARVVLPSPPGAAAERPGPASAAVPDASLYAGMYYNGSSNSRLTISADSGMVLIAGSPPTRLLPDGARRFRLPTASTVLAFQPSTGKAQTMSATTDGRSSTYTRVEPALDPSAFPAYAGRYRSAELGIEWIVTAADGRVAIVDERGDRTPVSPIFRDAFAGPGTVRFERDHRGKVTALIMTTTGVYALRFSRVSPKPRHVPQ